MVTKVAENSPTILAMRRRPNLAAFSNRPLSNHLNHAITDCLKILGPAFPIAIGIARNSFAALFRFTCQFAAPAPPFVIIARPFIGPGPGCLSPLRNRQIAPVIRVQPVAGCSVNRAIVGKPIAFAGLVIRREDSRPLWRLDLRRNGRSIRGRRL